MVRSASPGPTSYEAGIKTRKAQMTMSDPPSPIEPAAGEPGPRRSLTSRVVHGSFLNLGGQVLTMVATLVATPFVIRFLGPSSYGVLALVYVMIGYLSFADMGMGTASTRFGSMAHARGDDEGEATAIWSALMIAAVPALTVGLLLFIGARPLIEHGLRIPALLQQPAVLAVRVASLGFVARAFAGVLNTPAIVRLRMDLVVLISTGTSAAQILLVPVVLFLGGGLSGAVAVATSATIAAAILHAVTGARLLPQLRRPRISRALLKPLVRFGGGLVVSTIATAILANLEKLLLPRYASLQALAFYSVAFTLANLLTQLPVAMLQSLVPAFSQLHASGNAAGLQMLYRRGLRGMLYWTLPGTVFICAAAYPFFSIWAGPRFGQGSTLPLYLLVGGIACEIISYVPYALLITFGRTDIIARCQLSLIIPYLIVAVVLIQRYGAAGAAVAWSLRALLTAILFASFARRVSGFSFNPWPDRVRGYLLALAVLLIPVGATLLIPTSALARVAIAGVAVALHGMVILTRVLTSQEREALRNMLPRLQRGT